MNTNYLISRKYAEADAESKAAPKVAKYFVIFDILSTVHVLQSIFDATALCGRKMRADEGTQSDS